MFQRLIDQQLERIRNSPQAGMLGEKVYEKLEGSLKRLTGLITQSTEAQLIARAADNPFAAALPALLTEEEKERAVYDEIAPSYGMAAEETAKYGERVSIEE